MVKTLLRGIVNHSNGKSLVDSDRNTKDNRLSGTNRYEVLENYDEVENAEIGTKCGDRYKKYDLSKIVRIKHNLIKTVKQPSCELSNRSYRLWRPKPPS